MKKSMLKFATSTLTILLTLTMSIGLVFADVTWDPNKKSENPAIISDGNLTVSMSGIPANVLSTEGKSKGKWYWEVDAVEGAYFMVGIAYSNYDMNTRFIGDSEDSYGYYGRYGTKYHLANNYTEYGQTYGVGDTIGVALDLDNHTLEFFKNGVSQGVAYNNLPEGTVYAASSYANYKNTGFCVMKSAFKKSDFKYTPPSGFSPFDSEVQPSLNILNVEPEKSRIKMNQMVTANVTIDNIKGIAAEDIRIKFDSERLKFVGFEESEGIKLVKGVELDNSGELRVIVASKGENNIVNLKKTLLKLKFIAIKKGEALIDITKGRVSDGIEMERDLNSNECGESKIFIDAITDVNNSGEYTLLDLGIDARNLNKDPNSLPQYNTDLDSNGLIDELDLSEIGKLMIENPNYLGN